MIGKVNRNNILSPQFKLDTTLKEHLIFQDFLTLVVHEL